jgi:nicotinic acid mononucleotide adenylyltransferase
MNARIAIAERLHALPDAGVFAVTGGGGSLLADLLTVPGASNTVLEARVPYAERALAEFVGAKPEQACSVETACDLAMAAFQRALALDDRNVDRRFGFGCTASLATTSPKRGDHRAHVALQTVATTRVWSVKFAKGARTREQEERALADVCLNALAAAYAIDVRVDAALTSAEPIIEVRADAPAPWGDLLLGRVRTVPIHGAEPPRVLFPGAFHPLHDGHRAMAQHAQRIADAPVAYEICVANVDKPRLNYLALRARLDQFDATTPVWITNTPTFVEKARAFPGAMFVVGADTISRIADPKYYGGDPARRDAAVSELAALGCRFLVFGRKVGARFIGVDDIALPDALRALCTAVAASDFRADVSSTEIRARASAARKE